MTTKVSTWLFAASCLVFDIMGQLGEGPVAMAEMQLKRCILLPAVVVLDMSINQFFPCTYMGQWQ